MFFSSAAAGFGACGVGRGEDRAAGGAGDVGRQLQHEAGALGGAGGAALDEARGERGHGGVRERQRAAQALVVGQQLDADAAGLSLWAQRLDCRRLGNGHAVAPDGDQLEPQLGVGAGDAELGAQYVGRFGADAVAPTGELALALALGVVVVG